MFRLLMISIGMACSIKNQHLQFLYPTEQEIYKLDMSELFDGEDLFYMCIIGDENPISDIRDIKICELLEYGIEIKNVITEVDYTPKVNKKTQNTNSVSGYKNYISTIQNNQLLNIFEINYTSDSITQLNSLKIEVDYDCQSYSSTFASSSNIITDCYNNDYFQLLLFVQNVPIVIYELYKPSFITNSIAYTNLVYINNYIIYGIYLNNNESFLHNYYYNETTQKAKFISRFMIPTFTDFSLTVDGNSVAILNLTNCIFISPIEDLNQYQQINITQEFIYGQSLAIKSFPSFCYGQLMTSFIIVNDNYYDNIFEFQYNGSNLNVSHIYDSYQQFEWNFSDPVKIYISTSFLIIQQKEYETYFYIGKFTNSHEYQTINQIYKNRYFEDSFQMYLNYDDNKLLKFSSKLTLHHLSKPKLIINITNQNQSGNITIYAYENPEVHDDIFFFGCNLTLSYQLLNQNNTNIYNTSNINKFSTIQDVKEIFHLNNHFTGPLMQLSIQYNLSNDSNISISPPQNQVLSYLNDNLPGLFQNQTQLFFVEQYQFLFYAWISSNDTKNIFYSICWIGNEILNCTTHQNISCNVSQVTSIQMSQYNQTQLVLVFDQSQNILVYSIQFQPPDKIQFNINITNTSLFYNYTINNQYQMLQFQILYNKLIVLYNQSEIIVNCYNYNKSTSYFINQTTINQVGGQQYNIQFQPIQIQVNQQLYQSTLFINNQNSFISLELYQKTIQNNNFNILSYQQTTYNISQIVVVQMYIILASIINSSSNMVSFFVYDISVINHPSFYKPLPNCTIQPNSQIIADNYFFYVRQIDYSIFIYSIDLPYHSSLYYNLSLNQYDSISCTNTNQFSILSIKNNLYAAFQNNPYSFQFYQVKQQDKMISQVPIQTMISNIWNNKIFNYQLIVVNIYLQISMNVSQYNDNNNTKYLTFYSKKNSKNPVLLPLNMTNVSMGQVTNYYIVATQNGKIKSNQSFNITNQFINENQYFTKYITNITQMTSFCRSLFYQNISGLYQSSYVIFEGLQLSSYSKYNFTECLSLSVTINGPSIYMNAICKSDKSITVFSLFPNASPSNNSTNYTCSSSQPWNTSNNTYQILNPPYTSIIKSSQLNDYLFILGKMGQNDNSQSIYIYNLNQTKNQSKKDDQNDSQIRRIQCRGGISDYNFTILQNKSLINSTYSGRGVIFYLCQNPSELKYVSFNITNSTNLTFSKVSNRVSDVITQYVNRSDSKFLQIFIYLVKYDQIILVLTSNNVYNLVIIMSYSPLSYAQTSLQFEDVIAYIPPYGNYTQIPIGVLQDQYLALLFRSPVGQKAQHIVAMYNISKIKQTYNLSYQLNYNSTIQMEGGYYFNESFENILQIALVNQTNNISQFLLVLSKNETMNQTDVTLLVFNQTIYFQCSNVSQLYENQNYDYYLVASNSFYNYNISITIQPEQLSNSIWAWILLVLTIIICTTLVIEFWKKIKMQNLEQNKSTELLEIEM